MLNIRFQKMFVVLFLFMSLSFAYGCHVFSEKPSEETMKGLIYQRIHRQSAISYNFEQFKVTNDSWSTINDEEWYCVEVNYKLKEIVPGDDSAGKMAKLEIMRIGKQEKYSFTKHGKEWYGLEGCK